MFDWLHEPERMLAHWPELEHIASEIKLKNFKFIVLLGMGGSSLAVKVFASCLDLKHLKDSQFFIVDTVHPSAIARLEQSIEIEHTFFIVASKSGSTLETNLLYQYFYSRLEDQGHKQPGQHFMAISDPGSPLLARAKELAFIKGPLGIAGIGGRYCALSPFGILPALIMGLDTQKLLKSALAMARDCGPTLNANTNPGAQLAVFLVSNLLSGRYILHLHCSPSLANLSYWLEQLIAESLGKNGTGIVPISNAYHNPTLSMHCYIELKHDPINSERLANSISFTLDNSYELGQEMFRWQMAISLTAIMLGINPFDQPDVERSKELAKKREIIAVKIPQSPITITQFLSSHTAEYCVLLSYLDENHSNQILLKSLCNYINNQGLSCLIQTGPRYLHSTGQLWKGGANKGLFIFISSDYPDEIKLENLNFSEIHKNQALNDYQTMIDCGRSVLHIDLKDIGDLCSLQ